MFCGCQRVQWFSIILNDEPGKHWTETVYAPIFKVMYLNYLRKTTKTTVRLAGLLGENRRLLKLRLFKEVIYSGMSNIGLLRTGYDGLGSDCGIPRHIISASLGDARRNCEEFAVTMAGNPEPRRAGLRIRMLATIASNCPPTSSHQWRTTATHDRSFTWNTCSFVLLIQTWLLFVVWTNYLSPIWS